MVVVVVVSEKEASEASVLEVVVDSFLVSSAMIRLHLVVLPLKRLPVQSKFGVPGQFGFKCNIICVFGA